MTDRYRDETPWSERLAKGHRAGARGRNRDRAVNCGPRQDLPDRRRPRRYSTEIYRIENKPLSVTVCLKLGTPAVLHHLADIVVEVMREEAEKAHIRLHAYCLMPDHMHIICSVDRQYGDFPLFMRTLKREAGRRIHKNGEAQFAWQRDYWDRFILKDENVIEAINYVLGNPVRRGLCERAEDWPASEHMGWAG
mgnify:FL=1